MEKVSMDMDSNSSLFCMEFIKVKLMKSCASTEQKIMIN